ncbi:MAG: hypothetical protein ACP5NM_00135 [Thiomonas sp.]
MIERLNRDCFCLTLDRERLTAALHDALGQPGLEQLIAQRNPHLFSAHPVFVSHAHAQRMRDVVQALEHVAALPGYRAAVLDYAPAAAQRRPGNPGVFLGVDFHLERGRLDLIEVNTNPGGALLSAVLARAQRACCDEMQGMIPSGTAVDRFEAAVLAMFQREWRDAGRSGAPRRIAIVDTAPQQQYLYAEFLLYQQLFARAGIDAVVLDPAELECDGHVLRQRGQGAAIDLVYNRLTDFALDAPEHAALRRAWDSDSAVITPHPQAHAVYADKRNLALLCDAQALRALGADPAAAELLAAHVPHTEIVGAANAERLWAQRRNLFFKPWAGYGSRAAYRGAKLTRGVWEAIVQGGYVAQTLAPAGERRIGPASAPTALKFDLRAYADIGQVLWLTARLYQGQTTNFRTPGGGFAPTFEQPAPQA